MADLETVRSWGLRDPDEWVVVEEDLSDGDGLVSFDSYEGAAEHAAGVRACYLRDWQEAEGPDQPYLGPDVSVEPVWIGDPRRAE